MNVCVCVCVRACVRACVRVCARARARAREYNLYLIRKSLVTNQVADLEKKNWRTMY
jgi:hypothetical protein